MARSGPDKFGDSARQSRLARFLGALVRTMPRNFSKAREMASQLQRQRPGHLRSDDLLRPRRGEATDEAAGTRLSARFQEEILDAISHCRLGSGRQRAELWHLKYSHD